MPGLFSQWQPRYAEYGIYTFPVRDKRPAVRGYLRVGPDTSAHLATKFADADALGFALGKHSRITVLDIDTPDEHVLAGALDYHGKTPIIVRSGSGNFQAWYRWNGERRLIRPYDNKPIDVLGGGYVVVPPSRGTITKYKFIEGNLDDLDHLPIMRGGDVLMEQRASAAHKVVDSVRAGQRNNTLWRHCMRHARQCDSLDALCDVAQTFNEMSCVPLLPDTEVVKTARSAWEKNERGENRFGRHGVWFSTEEANSLIKNDPDKYLLLSFLIANNLPRAEFMIANGLDLVLGMPRKRLAAARRRLEQSHVDRIRNAGRSVGPALYVWKKGGPI